MVKIIGHAGARGLAPGNTAASFKKAIEYNVDAIEFDVRVTKDQVPVLHHDAAIHSTVDKRRLVIDDETLAVLRKHQPDLATLEGTIRIIDHAVPLHIEIKPGVSVQPIITIIQQFLDSGWKKKEFLFTSFDGRILQAFHHAFPDCKLIVLGSWSGLRAARRARSLGTRHICMNQRWLWRLFIRLVVKQGYILGAYTVNTPRQARKWQKLGLDSIVTDFPDRFTVET